MPSVKLEIDAADIGVKIADVFAKAGPAAPGVIRRAVNRTGASAVTAITRALVPQTGLSRRVIVKALRKRPASFGGLSYAITVRGGNVSLKYFKARETRAGVSAAPWGKRQVFAGRFIKGGHFPGRVPLPSLNGQVWFRAGKGRLPIAKARSGLFIPTELITGASASVFLATVRAVLPARLAHELSRLLGGTPGGSAE